MRSDEVRVQLQSLLGCVDHVGTRFMWRTTDNNSSEGIVGGCEIDLCRREGWIVLNCLLEVGDAFLNGRSADAWDVHSFEVALIHFGCHRTGGHKPYALLTCNRGLHLFGNGSRYITLKRQYILNFAVILLRPEVFVPCGANQLRVNTNMVAVADERTFDNGIRA